jgi:hypothetical protein
LTSIERSHPLWTRSFETGKRIEMIDDDLWAGKSVATLLVAVVSLGLIAVSVTLLALLLL